VNHNSGKLLDVCGVCAADNACVPQSTRSGGPTQQWQFVDSGGGYHRPRARHSGKVLDVYNWSTADSAAIVQWADHNGSNRQFRLARVGGPTTPPTPTATTSGTPSTPPLTCTSP
jgi:endo-1,4-beta-xylanase